jgi:hypothetical protein
MTSSSWDYYFFFNHHGEPVHPLACCVEGLKAWFDQEGERMRIGTMLIPEKASNTPLIWSRLSRNEIDPFLGQAVYCGLTHA